MEALIQLNQLKTALAQAVKIDEVKKIRDKSEAIRAYHKQAGDSFEMQNHCAEIKVRAERRMGELLGEMEKNKGAATSSQNEIALPKKLSDLGIDHNQSHRYQRIASIPEEAFEAHLNETVGNKRELTSAGFQRLAKTIAIDAKSQETPERETCVIHDLHKLVESGKKFGTIYADPPWKYGNQGTRAATNNHYETMTVNEIAELPIKDLTADEAHLHLWTTNAFLFESKKILEAWGFEYKGVFIWVKPQIGLGNYWRVSHEFMVLGIRGSLPFADQFQRSWLQERRTTHSAKPESVRRIIELVSPGPFLELFGRRTTEGWVVWGNEVERTLFNAEAFHGSKRI